MLIDWFTVGAQALNFLILVWLMKRFLYKPILNAIDAREQLIAKELADADAKKAEAGKERDAFAHKNQEFDQARAAQLTKVADEAKSARNRLMDEARKAADAMSAKRQELLQSDARNLHAALSRRTQDEVFAIARKTLADLASVSLEERLVAVFERRLHELDDRTRSNLRDAMRSATEPALLRSAFDLPPAQREALQTAINVMCSADIHLRFETAPDVIGGIELTSSGNKVSWSIAAYLSVLEKAVEDVVQQQAKPEPHEAVPPTTHMETAQDKPATTQAARPDAATPSGPVPAPTPQAAASPATPPPTPATPVPPIAEPQPAPVAPAAATSEPLPQGAPIPTTSTPAAPTPAAPTPAQTPS